MVEGNFHEAGDGALEVIRNSWEKEASFRLPASTWRGLMDACYPDIARLCLRKEAFNRLDRYRSRRGLPNPEAAVERSLSAAEDRWIDESLPDRT